MISRSRIAVLVLAALLSAAACSKKGAPKPKTKEEVFALFEKHRETYIRCEKLLAAERALPSPVAADASGPDAGADAEADSSSAAVAPSASAPSARPGAAIRKSAPPRAASDGGSADAGHDASAASNADAAPLGAPSAVASAPAVRPGEAQTCHEDYFRELKKELGPYDQTAMDTWYAEWRQGVKIE